MRRRLEVTVDRPTWTSDAFPFPPTFPDGTYEWEFHVPAFLLMIGFLTTPSFAHGITLSEFWAWVRYQHAISTSDDLRITHPFAELDPHQKTILSDDFGMGAPMLWLNEHLRLIGIADGRYFVERILPELGGHAPKPGKKGLAKCPDFVALDTSGAWHVVECKGTQSGRAYRDRQLHGTNDGQNTGAIAQKRSIQFGQGIKYQRLACGLSIAAEGARQTSNLRIIDPPPEEESSKHSSGADYVVPPSELKFANDAFTRGVFGRSLRLAGFNWISSAITAPAGPRPSSRSEEGEKDRARQDFMERKRKLAADELANFTKRYSETIDNDRYFGRSAKLELPLDMASDRPFAREVNLRFLVNEKALEFLRSDSLYGDESGLLDSEYRSMLFENPIKIESGFNVASFEIAKLFKAQIELRLEND